MFAATQCLLVVEVADSSLGHDRTVKAARYAAAGVREYWVINARKLETTVLRDPHPETGYADKREYLAGELETPLLAKALALRLTDLDIE